ncbi:MAG: hypothetical protein EOM20_03510 [Spartobacteria bacterium]|nr:hypothetical protein [Spartobacteria bacterium]
MKDASPVKTTIRQRQRRKLLFGLNTITSLLLLLALLAMVNYLSYRHFKRGDWSRTKYYCLSDKSVNLLADLTNTVDVIVFFQSDQEVYEDIEKLLKEYESASRRIHVEWVDPDRDIARTESLAAQYDVDRANVVVFDCNGRSKYVTEADIVEFDYAPMQYGQRPAKVAFKGENAFSSAIQSITQARKPVVYFLQGHGEGDMNDPDRRTGFSRLAREIHRDNIDSKLLDFGKTHTVPEDCDLLIILGPEKAISGPEIDLIEDYLNKNGRLLLLLDAFTETGIEELLHTWGVQVSNDLVVDGSRTLTGRELFVSDYGNHPVVAGMNGITSIFYLPRSVEPVSGVPDENADRPSVVALAYSSMAGWAESDLDAAVAEFDMHADRPGPVAIAVAVEKGPVPGIDVRIRPTRMVIFGDSDFVSNGALAGGGMDLFMSSLNWLLERDEAIGLAPRPFETSQLMIDRRQLQVLFGMVVIGLPLAPALLGLLVWARRRG